MAPITIPTMAPAETLVPRAVVLVGVDAGVLLVGDGIAVVVSSTRQLICILRVYSELWEG